MTAQRATSAYFRTVTEPPDEVIEDSEPERQEARRVERLRRRAQKEIPEATVLQSRMLDNLDVIETQFLSNPSHLDMDNTVAIQMTDENDLPSCNASMSGRESLPAVRSKAFAAGFSTKPDGEERASQDVRSSELLNLTRFAYAPVAGPSNLTRQASRTPSDVTTHSDIEVLPSDPSKSASTSDARKSKGKAVKPSAHSHADFDASSILRCPACQISWTARKSASAKMEHVRKCAKKKGIGQDDLRRLLEEEAASVPSGSGLKKGKGKKAAVLQTIVAPPRSEPQTYLEDVVEGAAPKKRKPRQATTMPVTVKPIAATRTSILDRAEALLRDSPLLDGGAQQSHQGAVQSDLFSNGEEEAPPATQQFTISNLAQTFIRPSSYPDTPEDLPELDGARAVSQGSGGTANAFAYFAQYESSPGKDPPHQPLTSLTSSSPSESLGTTMSARSKGKMRASVIEISDDDDEDAPANASLGSLRSRRPSRSPPSTPAKRGTAVSSTSLTPALKKRLAIFESEGEEQRPEPEDDGWSDTSGPNLAWDGVYTAREPISGTGKAIAKPGSPNLDMRYLQQWASQSPRGMAPAAGNSGSESSIPLVKGKKKALNKPRAGSPSGTRNAKTPKQRKATAADPGTANEKKMSDRDLFNRFRATIYQDEVLHCRILRYEPIPFDHILAKMQATGIQSSQLKPKLKAFLDASCVNHYGADGSRNR